MSIEKISREERNPKYARRITRTHDSFQNENENESENEDRENKASSMSAKSDISIINSNNRFEVIYTNIEKVKPYGNQARAYFDQEEIEALSRTILEHGIRQPLTVIGTDDGFQVVSGERRLRAAKLAGLSKVPIIIINDDKKAEELALIENIQRKDLHPIELGKAYAKILTRTLESPSDLALRLAVSANQVYEYSAYAKIPTDIAESIIRFNLGRRAFLRELLKCSPQEMQAIIAEEVKNREVFSLPKESISENKIAEEVKPELKMDLPYKGRSEKFGRPNFKKEARVLMNLKIKNGKIDCNETGILKSSKEELYLIKYELEKTLKLVERMIQL